MRVNNVNSGVSFQAINAKYLKKANKQYLFKMG